MEIRKAQALQSCLDVDGILDEIKDNFTPEEVFGEAPLVEWAEENGYTKE